MESSADEYSVDEDDQLQPQDTLVDRGVDDVLDEGYSPPERPVRRWLLRLDARKLGTAACRGRAGSGNAAV